MCARTATSTMASGRRTSDTARESFSKQQGSGTRDRGLTTKRTVMASVTIPMVTSTKASGRRTPDGAGESTSFPQETCTKASGSLTILMDKGGTHSSTSLTSRANTLKQPESRVSLLLATAAMSTTAIGATKCTTATASYMSQTSTSTQVSFKTACVTELENAFTPAVSFTTATGEKMRETVPVNIRIATRLTKEAGDRTRKRVLAIVDTPTAVDTWATGKLESTKATASDCTPMDLRMRENGNQANVTVRVSSFPRVRKRRIKASG